MAKAVWFQLFFATGPTSTALRNSTRQAFRVQPQLKLATVTAATTI
jgi:hypothetical protein